MIKEIFSSFSRTLGRILAYFFIGFIIFFLFSKVKAESIITNDSYIQSIRSDWSVGFNTYSTSLSDYSPGALGFQWSPVDDRTNFYPLKASEYYINLQFVVAYNTTLLASIMPNFSITVGSLNVNASCDGYQELLISNREVRNGQLYNTYDYVCDSLVVSHDFDKIRFRENLSSIQNNLYQVQLFITDMQILDINNLNPDVPIITDSITNNTNKIINNQNTNTQTIINNNNSNTTRITDKQDITNQKLDNINNSLIDNTPPDVTIFQNIGNYQPSNTPLTDIITLPITIINNEINGLNGTCQAWTFGTGPLLGSYTITIPCLDMSRYFTTFSYQGYNLWQIIDFMCCLFMGYQILMLIISAYNDISSLNDTFHRLYTPTSYWAEPGKVYYS